jgi:hypothetical protein
VAVTVSVAACKRFRSALAAITLGRP